MSHVRTLLGILTGVAIGTTLGVLFAPDKGSATRRKVGRKNEAYVDMLEKKFNDMLDALKKNWALHRDSKDLAKAGAFWGETDRKESLPEVVRPRKKDLDVE